MKKYKHLSYLFALFAIFLSDIMSAAVAYNFCSLQLGENNGYSAPANVAFLLCIPYGIAIIFCIVIACFFYKKYKNSL